MTDKNHIPANEAELASWATVKGWERSALVFAWTIADGRGGDQTKAKDGNTPFAPGGFTAESFAGLGIVGLTYDATVRWYRKIWADAVEAGSVAKKYANLKPGDEWPKTWPKEKFPPARSGKENGIIRLPEGGTVTEEKAAKIAKALTPEAKKAVVKALIEEDRDTVADAVVETPGTGNAVDEAYERKEKKKKNPKTEQPNAAVVLSGIKATIRKLDEQMPEFTALVRDGMIPDSEEVTYELREHLRINMELLDSATAEVLA